VSEVDTLERLLDYLSRPGAAEAIEKMLAVLDNLERSGVLDLLQALTDPDVVERLSHILVTPGLLRLLDNLDKLTDTLSRVASALEEPAEPASLGRLLAELRDPEVRRGLARLLAVIREIGRA